MNPDRPGQIDGSSATTASRAEERRRLETMYFGEPPRGLAALLLSLRSYNSREVHDVSLRRLQRARR